MNFKRKPVHGGARKGAGRPPSASPPRTVARVAYRLDEREWEQARIEAEREELSVHEYARERLLDAIAIARRDRGIAPGD